MVLVWQIKDDLPNLPNLPNFLPAKLSHYMVIIINSQRYLPNFPSLNLLRTEFTELSFLLYDIAFIQQQSK